MAAGETRVFLDPNQKSSDKPGRSFFVALLFVDRSAFHYKANSRELTDVRDRIPLDRDDVGELSGFDRPEVVALIEELCGD